MRQVRFKAHLLAANGDEQALGGFQLKLVSTSFVISHMPFLKFEWSHCIGGKLIIQKNPLHDLLSSLNAVISSNERH